MINFSKQLGVVTTAIALTSATVGVLPAAAEQIIKHEFSGTLELLSSSRFFSSEPPPPTRNYEGLVEYTNQGALLSWFLDVEGLSRQGFERAELWLFCSTITSPTITSPTITLVPINPPPPRPFLSGTSFITFNPSPITFDATRSGVGTANINPIVQQFQRDLDDARIR
ncbi:MAG: hypothetical protein F6K56_11800 [Moorea sp. SIO3G5]|nr:hypothetical protein [Moorena sp. SIO3G5]